MSDSDDLARVLEAQKRAAAFIRATEAPKVTAMSVAAEGAFRGLGKPNLGNRTALAEAAKAYLDIRPLVGPTLPEP